MCIHGCLKTLDACFFVTLEAGSCVVGHDVAKYQNKEQ